MRDNGVLLGFLLLFPLLAVAVYPSGQAVWTSTVAHKYPTDQLQSSKVRASPNFDTWFLAVYQNRSQVVRFNNNGGQTVVRRTEPTVNAKLSGVTSDGSVWLATQASAGGGLIIRKLGNDNAETGPNWNINANVQSFAIDSHEGDVVIALAALGPLTVTSSLSASQSFNPSIGQTSSFSYFLRLKADGNTVTGSFNKGTCNGWYVGDIAVVPNKNGGNNVVIQGSLFTCGNSEVGWPGANFSLSGVSTTAWMASFLDGDASSALAFLTFYNAFLINPPMQLKSYVGDRFLGYIAVPQLGINAYAYFDTELNPVSFGFNVADFTTYCFASDLTKGWLISIRTDSGVLGGSIDDIDLITAGTAASISVELVTRNSTASSGVIGGSYSNGLSVFGVSAANSGSGTFVAGFNVKLNFCPDSAPFECLDRRCVTDELQCFQSCDKTVCSDGSCSDSCPQDVVCPQGSFLCPNGTCQADGSTCQGSCPDGSVQCFDGSCSNNGTCNPVPFTTPALSYEVTVALDLDQNIQFTSASDSSESLGTLKIRPDSFNNTLSGVNNIVLNLGGAEISSFKDLTNVDGRYVGLSSFLSSVVTVEYSKGFGTAFQEGSSPATLTLQASIPNLANTTFCLAKRLDEKNWTCVDGDLKKSNKRGIIGDFYDGIVDDPQGTWAVLLLGGSEPEKSSYTGIPGTDDTSDSNDNNESKATSFFKIGVAVAVGIAVLIIIISVIAAVIVLKRKRENTASKMSNSTLY